MDNSFITKYRPISLDEVIGNGVVVTSLKDLTKNIEKMPHCYILHSEHPGLGKTSLARILAKIVHCDDNNIIEVDAGVYTGIDAMRNLQDSLNYAGFGDNANKFIIIDEAHALSAASWKSLLKIVEEPPRHVYFVFCTTDIAKIPEAIKTRCHCYKLLPVLSDKLLDLLEFVCNNEQLLLSKEQLKFIADNSKGSPRQALCYLSQCRACKTIDEIIVLIETSDDNKEVIDLFQSLLKKDWSSISKILKSLKTQNLQPETIRIQLANLLTAYILNARNPNDAVKYLTILDHFSKPIYENTGWAVLTLACGGANFGIE